MARAQRPWFRFYVEALSDRKLRRLTPGQRWLWVAVLGAARQSPISGVLLVSEHEPMGFADLADIAGMTVKDVERTMPAFEAAGMLEVDASLGAWTVKNWAHRQYESDDVTQRTRKHRSQEQRRNVPTTFPGTPPETETETDPPQSSYEATAPCPPIVDEDIIREAERRTALAIERGGVSNPSGYQRRVADVLRAEGWRPPNPNFIPGTGPLGRPPGDDDPPGPMPAELTRIGRHPIRETDP